MKSGKKSVYTTTMQRQRPRVRGAIPPLPEPVRMPDGELFEEYGGQSMEGLSEELMRELGFTTQVADSDLSEDSTTRVPAAAAATVVPQDLNVGYIAEPGDDE